jgi:hypothetical protein
MVSPLVYEGHTARTANVMPGLWSAGMAAAIVDIRNRAAAVENRSPRRHVRTYDVPIARTVTMNTLPHSSPLHAASHHAGPGWYWMVPRVAIALFLLAIGTLVWWLHRNDLDEQRATMINDVLWMEQDLRFHLDRNAEQMAQIGREAADGRLDARVIEARQRNMIANGHGLLRDRRGWPNSSAAPPICRPMRPPTATCISTCWCRWAAVRAGCAAPIRSSRCCRSRCHGGSPSATSWT